jgi:hypothetical protein
MAGRSTAHLTAHGGDEQEQRPPAAAVPEPSGLLVAVGLLPLVWMRTRNGASQNRVG